MGSHLVKGSMGMPASVSSGAGVGFALAVPGSVYVQVLGSFTATYQIQGSNDGETWEDTTLTWIDLSTGNFASGVAGPGLYAFGAALKPPPFLRFACTAYTSGAPTATFSYTTHT